MSVKAYDDAIINEFRRVFNDNTIHILPVENAIRFSAQLTKDNVKFPMISTTRLGYSIRTENVNFSAKMIGSFVTRDGKNNNIFAQTVPIRIEYQMDVFTVDRESCDEIVRELIFFFMQHPTLTAHFEYGLDIDHTFNLYLNSEIVDNSDTVEHVNTGVMFRNTLTFYTDDALLFRSKKQRQGEIIANVATLPKKD
jgi:hypothetical protein